MEPREAKTMEANGEAKGSDLGGTELAEGKRIANGFSGGQRSYTAV